MLAIDNSTVSKYKINFFIWLYFTDVLIHLITCFYHINKIQHFTKIFLMPLLLIVYFQITNDETRSNFVVYGLIGGAFGDVFLIFPHIYICFFLGLSFFLIGHILYIGDITCKIELKIWKEKMWTALGLLIFFGCFCSYMFKYYIREGLAQNNAEIPGIIYLSALGLLNSASIFYFINKRSKYSLLTVLGTIIFFLSDFILERQLFYKDKNYFAQYYDLIVMFTYIVAQTLIAIGLSNSNKKENILRQLLDV